jgi:glycine/D-amino acid oxidase-like deaminating enzyme
MGVAVRSGIFHSDFRDTPLWWDDFAPCVSRNSLPSRVDVVIIGAGYTGLTAGAELVRHGLSVAIVDQHRLGEGASTRNGGQVSASVSGQPRHATAVQRRKFQADLADEAMQAFTLIEKLCAEPGNEALYRRCGRFDAAWTSRHFAKMSAKADQLNAIHPGQAILVPPDQQRGEIGSDYYAGGMCVSLAGALHPSLFFKSLLNAAITAGCTMVSGTQVVALAQESGGWQISTADRGKLSADVVLVATNGYTGPATADLHQHIVPIASHMIATEELSADLANSLLPTGRIVVDSKRVLYYYRLSPDGRRMLFGGRSRFTQVGARTSGALLHAAMIARFPQLSDTKITHSWTGNLGFTFDHLPHVGHRSGLHYALGCNGSGIAVMTYLGRIAARNILQQDSARSVFERIRLPGHPLYTGSPWFLPALGGFYRFLDAAERRLD